ncbi:MAG: hypothetical protein Q9P44_15320 [Anaerolineae bacterium]|nr:hypothetical protein [Anaerolineae bacterium]
MPIHDDLYYEQLLQLIEAGKSKQVIQEIVALGKMTEQTYVVSRLYKGIYPHIDKAAAINIYGNLQTVLEAIAANAFLFDLALSVVDQGDIRDDIRSDLQHAITLKRMLAHAFKEAIDLDYTLTDELMLELDKARAILQTIIAILQTVLQKK